MNKDPVKIKVCGNKNADNLNEVIMTSPDYLGFILYEPSPRGLSVEECEELVKLVPETIKKTAVIVDYTIDEVYRAFDRVKFSALQLHGDQTLSFIRDCRKKFEGEIIKVFSIDKDFDFSICQDYESLVDYFLFDVRGDLPGGNGYTFNWEELYQYKGSKPFFIAGGISSSHTEGLKKLYSEIPKLYGFDINSGFETSPGMKCPKSINNFISEFRR